MRSFINHTRSPKFWDGPVDRELWAGKRIRTGDEVRRVTKGENVLDPAQRESLTLSETRLDKLLPEPCEEMRTA